jgi:hypothetical protein
MSAKSLVQIANALIEVQISTDMSATVQQQSLQNGGVLLDAVIQINRRCGTAGEPTSSRNGYKNGYSNEKEGQPFRAGLLVSLLL